MLEYKLTRRHAGVALWGDFSTLERLHEFIHRVVQESSYIEDKEGFVLGLAYDLRKAFEGHRSEGYRDHSNGDHSRIYGVEILWPILLVQVGVLRQAMASMPTSKLDQAIMFELEHIVDSALRAAAPGTADEIIYWTQRTGSASYAHLNSVLDGRSRYFIGLPSRQRLKALPRLMETFDPMYEFLAENGIRARSGGIPPSAFVDDGQEWPDFEW